MSDRGCSHLDTIESIKQPQRRECEECERSAHLGFICAPARHVELRFAATARQIGMQASTRMPADILSSRPHSRGSVGCIATPMRCFANIETRVCASRISIFAGLVR
jgi:hypothetical protein